MTDFYQTGPITTIHSLDQDTSVQASRVPELRDALVEHAQQRPVSLILPCLYSELETEAMPRILDELSRVDFIKEIIIGLDRASEAQYRHALELFSVLPQRLHVLWNDGPRLRAIHGTLADRSLAPLKAGKGRNVWYCMGVQQGSGVGEVVALHDCDILTYQSDLLARLVYPLVHPDCNFVFAKGYYARYADSKLNGRVCRLLMSPLLRSLRQLLGASPVLDYLDSFRYALSGEFAMLASAVPDTRLPSDWGLEIGLLCDIYHRYSTNQICQVDIADRYDHKHQPLGDDSEGGLVKMVRDITRTLLKQISAEGAMVDDGILSALHSTYLRSANEMTRRFQCDAVCNGLDYDVAREHEALNLFASTILEAGRSFREDPGGEPDMPTWRCVRSAEPDIPARLLEAVHQDMAQFGKPDGKLSKIRAA
ncbi:glycosyl transferase [Allohahella marinimesophila]|uniref:Cell wall biogenesis glycosyltransferase n=1 Tax=Allohahella marinimesophila TaxID=1054972 RepID=A0ABP7PL42_9GAMM